MGLSRLLLFVSTILAMLSTARAQSLDQLTTTTVRFPFNLIDHVYLPLFMSGFDEGVSLRYGPSMRAIGINAGASVDVVRIFRLGYHEPFPSLYSLGLDLFPTSSWLVDRANSSICVGGYAGVSAAYSSGLIRYDLFGQVRFRVGYFRRPRIDLDNDGECEQRDDGWMADVEAAPLPLKNHGRYSHALPDALSPIVRTMIGARFINRIEDKNPSLSLGTGAELIWRPFFGHWILRAGGEVRVLFEEHVSIGHLVSGGVKFGSPFGAGAVLEVTFRDREMIASDVSLTSGAGFEIGIGWEW